MKCVNCNHEHGVSGHIRIGCGNLKLADPKTRALRQAAQNFDRVLAHLNAFEFRVARNVAALGQREVLAALGDDIGAESGPAAKRPHP